MILINLFRFFHKALAPTKLALSFIFFKSDCTHEKDLLFIFSQNKII